MIETQASWKRTVLSLLSKWCRYRVSCLHAATRTKTMAAHSTVMEVCRVLEYDAARCTRRRMLDWRPVRRDNELGSAGGIATTQFTNGQEKTELVRKLSYKKYCSRIQGANLWFRFGRIGSAWCVARHYGFFGFRTHNFDQLLEI